MKQDITVKREATIAYANSLAADFYRYLDKRNIDYRDGTNELVQKRNRIVTIANTDLYLTETAEEVEKLEQEVRELAKLINK